MMEVHTLTLVFTVGWIIHKLNTMLLMIGYTTEVLQVVHTWVLKGVPLLLMVVHTRYGLVLVLVLLSGVNLLSLKSSLFVLPNVNVVKLIFQNISDNGKN
ncbi:hypothetical protein U3516DRAFT_892846 [Neocallimastix sp. 'constans']